ncbi:MAG: FtsB family cell division protein [Alphaproteobacteria bacterium]
MKFWVPRKLSKSLVPSMLGLTLMYFIYHAIQGERGIFGWMELSRECELQERHLQALMLEKEELETKVGLMSKEIDPDLLEYQVRLLLGYAASNEMIILKPVEADETP